MRSPYGTLTYRPFFKTGKHSIRTRPSANRKSDYKLTYRFFALYYEPPSPTPVCPHQILFSLPLFLHSSASCKVSLPWDFTRDYPGPLFRDRSPCKIPFRSVTDEGETNSTFFIFLRPAVSLFRESLLAETRTLHLSLLTCESDLANPFFLLLNAISISHRIVYNARFYFVALCRTFF